MVSCCVSSDLVESIDRLSALAPGFWPANEVFVDGLAVELLATGFQWFSGIPVSDSLPVTCVSVMHGNSLSFMHMNSLSTPSRMLGG